ncbi:hypothetical protein ACFL9T_06990 [Thermodesulfobacteriota bacterium]
MSKTDSFSPDLSDIPAASWDNLTQKKIYMGHRSVGNNIIEGLRDLKRENPKIRLNIVDLKDKPALGDGCFAHSWIVQNASPQSLAENYFRLADEIVGEGFDIALIRFTPFYDNRKMKDILIDYEYAFNKLKQIYPKTIFIHGTFPLTHSKTTWRTWIKKLVGKKEMWEYDDNIKVNEFNEMIRKRYLRKEPFLDIAALQSTSPDGSRSTFQKDGKTYFHMVKDYTYDGVHLNETGRKKIAKHFLFLLSNLI